MVVVRTWTANQVALLFFNQSRAYRTSWPTEQHISRPRPYAKATCLHGAPRPSRPCRHNALGWVAHQDSIQYHLHNTTTAHSSLHFECIAWACIHTVCCSVAIRVVVGDSTPTYACNNFGAVVGACIDAIIKRIAVGINVSQ